MPLQSYLYCSKLCTNTLSQKNNYEQFVFNLTNQIFLHYYKFKISGITQPYYNILFISIDSFLEVVNNLVTLVLLTECFY